MNIIRARKGSALAETKSSSLHFPDWKAAGIAFVAGLLLAPVLHMAPVVGWDWFYAYFQNKTILFWYPPWTSFFTAPFALTMPWRWGLAFANAMTVAAVTVATFRESRGHKPWGYVGALMAVFSLPMLLLLWNGQVDGWGLIGYLILPWGVPLLLIKPTIGAFALLARKDWFVAGAIFAIVTLVLWPQWPLNALGTHVVEDYPDVFGTLGWYKTSWVFGVLGLVFMLFTNRKDPIHLMTSGVFLMPYVYPYHMVFILPVFGRLKQIPQLLLWLASWISLLPYAAGNQYSVVGYLFPTIVWFILWRSTPKQDTWLALGMDLWNKSVQRLRA